MKGRSGGRTYMVHVRGWISGGGGVYGGCEGKGWWENVRVCVGGRDTKWRGCEGVCRESGCKVERMWGWDVMGKGCLESGAGRERRGLGCRGCGMGWDRERSRRA